MTDRCTVPCSQEGHSKSEIIPLNTAFKPASLLACDTGFAAINEETVKDTL